MNEINKTTLRFELWQEYRKERVKEFKNIKGFPNIKQLLSEQDRFIEKEFSYYEDDYILIVVYRMKDILANTLSLNILKTRWSMVCFFNSHRNGLMILKVDSTMPIIRIY